MFAIQYTEDSYLDLAELRVFDQRRVLDEVDRQLVYHPTLETRNRKPMRAASEYPWELRLGDLRVFYEVFLDELIVQIVAVGRKIGSKIVIRERTGEP